MHTGPAAARHCPVTAQGMICEVSAPGWRSNEEVERLLTEVIKRVPNLAEPYQTLGTMCLDSGQARRALNFFMIAAHLTPKDVHQWRRMAGLSTAQGYLRQAIYCLSKVGRRPMQLPGRPASWFHLHPCRWHTASRPGGLLLGVVLLWEGCPSVPWRHGGTRQQKRRQRGSGV